MAWVILSTDIAVWGIVVLCGIYAVYVQRIPPLASQWKSVFKHPAAIVSSVLLSVLILIALVDSIHYRLALKDTDTNNNRQAIVTYSPQTTSLLDSAFSHLKHAQEKTYSQPLHSTQWIKETALITINNQPQSIRDYPPLLHGGKLLRQSSDVYSRGDIPSNLLWGDIFKRMIHGFILGGLIAVVLNVFIQFVFKYINNNINNYCLKIALTTLSVVCIISGIVWHVSLDWHVLGTDRAGNDVLYTVLKSIRTAWVIAMITTLASVPFAVVLGLIAGTMRGVVDSVIQYIYTVLSSIPSVLLIAPCALMLQTYVDNHLNHYETALERADIQLFALCLILGLTSWAGLARLLRGEALKLREMEFVLAARAFGVPSWKIILTHMMPNVLHLIILSIAMEFSALVLYEAVLSYIGIGVDPTIQSFGGMINAARTELSRNPMIAWPLLSAFTVMLIMVLSANIVADALRDAFDPKR